MPRVFTFAFLCVTFASAALPVSAAVLFGNLPNQNEAVASTISTTSQKAVVFTVGNAPITVTSVDFRFLSYFSSENDVATLGFYSESSSFVPGALVGSLTAPVPSSFTESPVTFSFTSAGLTLAANTRYWMLLDSAAGSWDWTGSSPNVAPSGTAATFDYSRRSGTDGASYADSTTYNGFQINGTIGAAPEPGRALLLAFSALGLLMRRRR